MFFAISFFVSFVLLLLASVSSLPSGMCAERFCAVQ